jgi:hypothetical protein
MSGNDEGTIERALIAEREVADAKRAGRKLAVDLLDDFARIFGGMAAFFQPYPAGMAPNPNANAAEFEKWSRLAVETAARLAPYQSPTFRAVTVAPAPEAGGKVRRFTLSIFERELGTAERVLVQRQQNGVTIEGEAAELDLARDPRTGRFAAKTEPDQAAPADQDEPESHAEPRELAGVTPLFPRRADRGGG